MERRGLRSLRCARHCEEAEGRLHRPSLRGAAGAEAISSWDCFVVPPDGGTPRNDNSGFTLVELLLAVTIFSVIAVALYSSFNAGIRVWRVAEENIELHQSARLALEGLAKELRNAINFAEEEDKATKEDQEDEKLIEKPDLLFVGATGELRFVTLSTRYLEEPSSSQKGLDEGKFRKELVRLSYSIKGDGEFVRDAGLQSEGFNFTDAGKEVLATGVEELKFEYSYEPEEEDSPPVWKNYWENQEGIPLGVKIYLKVSEKDGRTGEFYKTVFIPTGILGKVEEEESEE